MKYSIPHARALFALMLVASAAGAAGQGRPLADPADANAPVPPTRYESTLHTPSSAATGKASPADNWKASNQAVAATDSMSMTMDMTEPKAAAPAVVESLKPASHAGHVMPPATQPDPHAMHHQMKDMQ